MTQVLKATGHVGSFSVPSAGYSANLDKQARVAFQYFLSR